MTEDMDCEGSVPTEGTKEAVNKVKRRKPGIIFMSSIPTGYNVMKIRGYFNEFGEVGRLFLQTSKDEKSKKSNSKKGQQYTEGWVEFKSKRKAKWVTMMLNGNRVGGKKKDPSHDELWNIKYLPRFKWAYLSQRLEYERESYRQRMGAAITQVRQEADHFIQVSERSEKKKKKEKKKIKLVKDKIDDNNESVESGKQNESAQVTEGSAIKSGFVFKQKDTETEIQKSRDKKSRNEEFKRRIANKKKRKQAMKLKKLQNKKPDEDFLGSVFVGSSN